MLGIDDAGRGPVIGPMVLAGCLMTEEVEKKLERMGVTDSKKLTQRRREYFEEIIKKECETFEIVLFYPDEIDGSNGDGIKLNELEGIGCSKIINEINKGFTKIKVLIDCPSPVISKWQDFVKTKINNLSNLEISCEHKADVNYTCVAAASILAKCMREKEMDKLKEIYGKEIGSGYCSDPATKNFLEKNVRKYHDKGIFRKTWITWRNANAYFNQTKLN